MKIRRLVSFLAVVCAVGPLLALDGSWTKSVSGLWSDVNNWDAATPADGSGATATFTIAAPGAITVTNDADRQLLGVKLGGSGFTLAGSTLTLDSAGFIQTLAGEHTLTLPLALSGDTAVTAVTNRALTLGGPISGSGGLTVNGGRVVLNTANSYSGLTVLQTGLLEVASISALGSGTAPVILGRGTFRYAGSDSADLARGYVVSNGGANASTVLDARTNLTVSGKVDAPVTGGGRFIKTGPGTVTYTYGGYQTMNRGGSGVTTDRPLVFDTVNGGAGVEGYHDFTVAEGKVVFNAVGQTNRIISGMTIGERYAAAAHAELQAGVLQVPDTWLSISRGNGDTNTPYASSLTVSGGRAELKGIVMGYGAGMPNYKSYPVLKQTGGEILISGDCYIGETGGSNPTFNMTGGKLICDGVSSGFALNTWNTGSLNATLNISGSGTEAYFAKLAVRSSAILSVSNGATIGVRSTETANPGTVLFDNATLTTYAPLNQPSEWFHNTTKLFIGGGGLTANVPAGQYAYFGTPPVTNPASAGGRLTKAGIGTLALYNTELPIDVNAGRLRLMGGHLTTNKFAKTISLAERAELELAMSHAAEADTLSLAGTTGFDLTVPNLAARPELWQANSAAILRSDGMLQLAYPAGLKVGSIFMLRPLSVTNAWRMDFSLAAVAGRTLGNQGDGVCFVVQNDARGAAAFSTNVVSGFGYTGGAAPVTNSFAVALDLTNRRLRFGTNGVLIAQTYDLSVLPGLGADSDKTFFSVSYDGGGTVTCSLTRKGMQSNAYTFSADLQSLVRSTRAFVGFTAGNTSTRYEQHLVGDIVLSTVAAAKSFSQYGGKLALATGQSLGVRVNPSPAQNGFGLGELSYADLSVLDIRQPTLLPVPEPTLAAQGLWRLNGSTKWKNDGRLAITSNGTWSAGTAFTTNLYPVGGSWTARFGYDIGDTSTQPADYITFAIQNSSPGNTTHTPNPGFAIMWRYYEGTRFTTQVKMYTNGVPQIASTDISPVSLINKLHATMTVSHDAAAKTVTVITEQATGAFTNVITGVNMAAAVGSASAYLGFGAATGGSYAENIVSDFSFETPVGTGDTSWRRGYLALGAATGSGTLVKRGNAALGIQDGPGNPFTNATVRLDEGGLVLRKLVCEPVTLGDDFFLSPKASWAPGGALQTMPAFTSQAGVGVTVKRHTVSQAWTARFTFFMAARSGTPADGFSFFLHNDVRGPAAVGGIASGSGYEGIGNSIGIRWNFYRNSMSNTVEYGQNGAFLSSTRTSHMPIALATFNAETDMLVRHDPAAKTLAVTMSQGTNSFSTTFTGVDIPAKVGDNLAYLGFGGGSGGEYCEARVKDFRFELDAPTNPLPAVACLGTAVLSAGSTNVVTLDTVVPDAVFAIGAVQFESGATLGLEAANANGGTLTLAAAALAGAGAFDVRSGTTLAVSNLTGGATLTKTGIGTLTLKGAVATYTGNTVLSAGRLSLDVPRLPPATDLYVTPGATLNLAFAGKQYVHALFVNGVPMPGGLYTASSTTWVTGDGILVVTYPPVGTLISVK